MEELGVGVRGHEYRRPFAAMERYLDAMDEAAEQYRAVKPSTTPPRVLAALGPRMLGLAAERAHGAHTYLVTPDHTAKARAVLGPDRLLAVEQGVVLEAEPGRARGIARRHVARYLDLPNYRASWKRMGFTDKDLASHGSDRLVDGLVAWGDAPVVADRIREHLRAGADHVCIQVFDEDPHGLPVQQWIEVAHSVLGAVGRSNE